MIRRLYVYASPQEVREMPGREALADRLADRYDPLQGSCEFAFEDERSRTALFEELIGAGLIAARKPLAAASVRRWKSFLAGGRPIAPNFAALLLGPFWMIRKALFAKTLLLASAWGVGFFAAVRLLPTEWVMGALVGGSGALWIYPFLFGEYDAFLLSMIGEDLWPQAPYSRFKPALAIVGAVGLGGLLMAPYARAVGSVPLDMSMGPETARLMTVEKDFGGAALFSMFGGGPVAEAEEWEESVSAKVEPRVVLAGDGLRFVSGTSLPCVTDWPADADRLVLRFAGLDFDLPRSPDGWAEACFLFVPKGRGVTPPAAVVRVPSGGAPKAGRVLKGVDVREEFKAGALSGERYRTYFGARAGQVVYGDFFGVHSQGGGLVGFEVFYPQSVEVEVREMMTSLLGANMKAGGGDGG